MPGVLPPHPSLDQLKLQAKELRRAHAQGKASAVARVAAQHPRMRGRSPQAVREAPLTLADAQLVVAREYGFRDWARLKHHIETGERIAELERHPLFDEALHALDYGDVARLRALVAAQPELVHARTNLEPPFGYFTGATLLHHVAGNPGRGRLEGRLPPLPPTTIALAKVLLEAGADVDAETLGPNGGTTMGLVLTSKQASDTGVSGPLIDLLLEYGARLDLNDPDVLFPSLSNHAPRAAEKLIELGAPADVLAAAALGRAELLRAAFDEEGRLRAPVRRRGRRLAERDAIGLAALLAYVNGHRDAVELLLEHDGNWDMTGVNNGALLHRAAWNGDLAMVQRLVARGADVANRDNPFHSTPLSWAQHNKQQAVFDWLREHCAIDLHEAVCHDLREHVEARLREDPAAVNRRLDQWEIPQCTPLHWAAWPYIGDVDGRHALDVNKRQELVALLLARGADPNVVAGDGRTPLDIAEAAGATAIAALLERHGGKRAAEL